MKQKIRIIIGMMGLALAGILGFQIYWIKNTYQINQERFEKDVQRALATTSERILGEKLITLFLDENDEIDNIVVRPNLWKSSFTTALGDSAKNSISNENKVSTEIISADVIKSRRTAEPSNSRFKYLQLSFNDTIKQDSAFDFQSLIDSKNKASSEIDQIISDTLLSGSDTIVKIEKLTQLNLTSNIHLQTLTHSQNYDSLESILREELDNQQINSGFEFGIRDNISKTYSFMSDSLLNQKTIETQGYSQSLNSIDLNNTLGETLFVHFPKQQQWLLSKMWLTFATSILLIGVTIVCFAYTLNTILKQKKLSEIKNDFINNMTHEFKTPIATVSLALEALLHFDVQKDKGKTTQYLNISKNETDRLGIMVEKVLKIAVSERQDIKLNLEKINVHELIEKVKATVNVQILQKGGVLQADLQAQQPIVEGDQVHLSNVLYNLMDNANKYSKGKPEIKITTKNLENQLKITVQDNGIGIAKQHQRHIFDKFYRVPTGNLHNVKGFGLGLSYVAMVVNRHLGKVNVISELNQGSIFEVYLPTL